MSKVITDELWDSCLGFTTGVFGVLASVDLDTEMAVVHDFYIKVNAEIIDTIKYEASRELK